MVQHDQPVGPDAVQVEFDDERVVSDAGVIFVATLAQRLGVEALAQQLVRLRRDRPAAANAGRKVMAVVFAMVLGADSIDDTARAAGGPHATAAGGLAAGVIDAGDVAARVHDSGMSASSMRCWARASSAPGRPAPGPARSGW